MIFTYVAEGILIVWHFQPTHYVAFEKNIKNILRFHSFEKKENPKWNRDTILVWNLRPLKLVVHHRLYKEIMMEQLFRLDSNDST